MAATGPYRQRGLVLVHEPSPLMAGTVDKRACERKQRRSSLDWLISSGAQLPAEKGKAEEDEEDDDGEG